MNASTIYYVRVHASTKVGPGKYGESKRFFTNGEPAENVRQTSKTLTFSLKLPTKTFLYFYVVALKATNAQEIISPDKYEDIDLVTYDGLKNRTNPKPYVAAVFTSSTVDGDIFVLGDSRITDDPTSRTTSDYFNGRWSLALVTEFFKGLSLMKRAIITPQTGVSLQKRITLKTKVHMKVIVLKSIILQWLESLQFCWSFDLFAVLTGFFKVALNHKPPRQALRYRKSQTLEIIQGTLMTVLAELMPATTSKWGMNSTIQISIG